jgi:hypothetical protein
MSRFGKCDHPQCEGHLSKFENCLAEALYNWGEFEDTAGDMDYGSWCHLIISEGSFTIPKDQGVSFDLHVQGPLYAVLDCDDQGGVDLGGFDTEQSARDYFDRFVYDYDLWVGAGEYVGA